MMTTTSPPSPHRSTTDPDRTDIGDDAPQSSALAPWWQRAQAGLQDLREELWELAERQRQQRLLIGNRIEDVPDDPYQSVDHLRAQRAEATAAARPATAAVVLAALLLAASMAVTAVWAAQWRPWVVLEQAVGPISVPQYPRLQSVVHWVATSPLPQLLLWLGIYAGAGSALARIQAAARCGGWAVGSRLMLGVVSITAAAGVFVVVDGRHGTAAAFSGTAAVLIAWRLAAYATARQARLVGACNRRYARMRTALQHPQASDSALL